ncbi:MAG TPA: type II secretion system F family protein, partial [Gaiellaceae bacterium]|nr:type II secretion system F family protein [Gaiellaceae bacterium]
VLKEERSSGFPDRAYLLQLPESRALTAGQIDVTENGSPVVSLAVQAPGGSASGAVLLIDASNSMKGAAIEGAMVAAREFLDERKADLPVAIVVFGPSNTVLADFTTDREKLAAAVARNPRLSEGTHIYDALIRVSELAKVKGLGRTTVVLLSDGTDIGSSASREQALAAAAEANMRVVSVGLQSRQYDPEALKGLAQATGGTYAEAANPEALAAIFENIGARLSSEYVLTYRSLLPPEVEAKVQVAVAGLAAPATASYTTPALDVSPRGTFEREWIDEVIVSPWLFVFVLVAILALLAFAVLTALDVRKRSLRRRMARYVSVPSEEESRARRAEVASMLAEKAQSKVSGLRSWQSFEHDVDLGGFKLSPLALAGWTVVGGIVASLVAALYFQSLTGLLLGLAAPFVTRFIVSRRVRKTKAAFDDQLPDNLDVLAGAMRTGHSMMGALAVMVDSADEPSKSEFRRVLQDEQLGVQLDDALMVMARRMQSYDAEQVAMVMKLQREAGGNTAEVLDRVAETIRGRMELRRLVNVLTAQARISRWILTSLPIFVFLMLVSSGGDYLDPMTGTTAGRIALGLGVVLIVVGSLWIKRIAKLDV